MSSPALRQIVATSLRLRWLVIATAVILTLAGLDSFQDMSIDVFPEFDPPQVEIQTEALGLAASEVESLITVPMEADLLNGVAWLDRMYSESVAGLSSIILVFEPGTDPIRARQMVQERLTQTFALPNVSRPPTMLQPMSSTSRVMIVGISSQDLSLIELGLLARWNIKPRLMGIPGVANVAVWGQRERQLQVQVDPKQLHARGVSLQQVIETAGNALWVSPLSFLSASTPGTAGWIDTPNQRLGLHHLLPISTPDDLAKVSVVGKQDLVLGQVATVVEDHQPLIGDAGLNDGPGLLLVIEKFPGADTLDITNEVEETLEAMRPGLAGVNIDTTIFRPANYISQAMKNLALAGLLGAVFIVLVLMAALEEWRLAVVSAIVIPLSVIVAGLVLFVVGSTINVLVIAGLMIAVGAIIDDAVIDAENIGRRLRQRRQEAGQASRSACILAAVLEMRRPLVFATLILLLLVLPVFFIPGLAGEFIRPLALAYVFVVSASLLVALTVTPVLGVMLWGTTRSERSPSPLIAFLRRRYQEALKGVLHASRRIVPGVIVIAVVVGLMALPAFTLKLLPAFKQTDLLIHWEGLPGMSRQEMNRVISQAGQEVRSIPGVQNVGWHIGRAVTGDQVVGINSGELWVNLDPAASYGAMVDSVQAVVDGYPGLRRVVQTYQPKRITEAITGANQGLVVRIYGNEFDILRSKAEEVKDRLARIDGIVDPKVQLPAEEPQVEIEVDLAAAERLGIKPGDVRRQATTLLSGLQVGNLFEKQKVFDVVVWGVPEIRHSMTNVSELMIELPADQVRLGDLAEVRIASTPTVIKRDAVSRYLDVDVPVRDRSKSSVAGEVTAALTDIEFPLEYHAELLGVAANQRAAQQRLLGAAIAAVVGVFLLLQAAFGSWRLALLALLILPAALLGGVLAALAGSRILSLGSLLGFIAVLGITVRHAVVMISHWQQLEENEGETASPALILQGAQERLIPVLATVFAIGLSLVPLLLFGSIPGYEILHPMAIVILGGLLTATLLSLFGLPALYMWFGKASADSQHDYHVRPE